MFAILRLRSKASSSQTAVTGINDARSSWAFKPTLASIYEFSKGPLITIFIMLLLKSRNSVPEDVRATTTSIHEQLPPTRTLNIIQVASPTVQQLTAQQLIGFLYGFSSVTVLFVVSLTLYIASATPISSCIGSGPSDQPSTVVLCSRNDKTGFKTQVEVRPHSGRARSSGATGLKIDRKDENHSSSQRHYAFILLNLLVPSLTAVRSVWAYTRANSNMVDFLFNKSPLCVQGFIRTFNIPRFTLSLPPLFRDNTTTYPRPFARYYPRRHKNNVHIIKPKSFKHLII